MSTDPSLIKILIVDDHPLLRKGIAAMINVEADMKLVAEASNGQEAIEEFRLHSPEVTLMDLQMPGLNGIEAIHHIRSEFPDARIIVLSTYTGDAQVSRALKAGARAFVLKRQVPRELLETIRAVHAGQRRIPVELAIEVVDHTADQLTPREVDVLRLIAAGKANKQIADQLSIGEGSVKSHVASQSAVETSFQRKGGHFEWRQSALENAGNIQSLISERELLWGVGSGNRPWSN